MDLKEATQKKIIEGKPEPLGASLSSQGVNFAIYSEYATQIYLILFDGDSDKASDTIALKKGDNHVWSIFVEGLKSGQLYGYRVQGNYDPIHAHRFNSHKVLIDPYAKALSKKCVNQEGFLFGYDGYAADKDLSFNDKDSSAVIPKSVVVDDKFDWQGVKSPNYEIKDLIIYEAHVKGFTQHPSAKVKDPGTYLGFIEKIPYLKKLGINAVEFLPIQAFYHRDLLIANGLSEYWGYNTIGFFAPEPSYSTNANQLSSVNEFKTLVKALHQEGIEVILDVVFNHTGEGNELGPTLCFKGIDNPTYYTLAGDAQYPYRYYRNDSGCGNTLNVEHSQVRKLILDSLHYWIKEMHIDGFRFDMASILGRQGGSYKKDSLMFKAIINDKVLQKVNMIAEPWDLTSYQVGDFPVNWSEWNGKFRDTTRRFIKGDQNQIGDFARRMTGSADLFGDDERSPDNSINFVTCHDGFTLNDLFSYSQRHNEENKENNRDGIVENHSWNCGAEGHTSDKAINQLRLQLIKNTLCCLLFSLGTPMLQSGDEILRTKNGNNNTYCQDNETTWLNWDLVKKNDELFKFCQKAIAFRKTHRVITKDKFLQSKDLDGDQVPDLLWFDKALKIPNWTDKTKKIIAYQLDGSEEKSELGNYHLFFIFNSDHKEHNVLLPQYESMPWQRVVDTSLKHPHDFLKQKDHSLLKDQKHYLVRPRSVIVLQSRASNA